MQPSMGGVSGHDAFGSPLLTAFQTAGHGKVVSAADAVRLIRDGDTVATGGFVGIGFAEEIAIALEELYLSTDERYLQSRSTTWNGSAR